LLILLVKTFHMKTSLSDKVYKEFVAEIKEKVYKSQYEAFRKVNKSMINLYWDIGKDIVEKQEKHNWGKLVVEKLAFDLQQEFPGVEGFSSRNLWRMRMFYLEYGILPPAVAEIGWSHNVVIMEKCKDVQERQFYIGMTQKYGWTKNVLIHHIEGQHYEQYLLGQTNFDMTMPKEYRNQAKLAVKDEYNLEFLAIREQHREKDLELAIMKNMRNFPMEMGGDFAFIGNQFKPEYAGKMSFYLSVLNDKVKTEEESASIGIIVCKDKDRTIVEYALKDTPHPNRCSLLQGYSHSTPKP